MKVSLEHAESVRRARALVGAAADEARASGLEPTFVSHAMLIEAMRLLLNCQPARAEALADGLMTIAMADQKQHVVHGFSDAVMAVALGEHQRDPFVRGRLRMLAGIAAVG